MFSLLLVACSNQDILSYDIKTTFVWPGLEDWVRIMGGLEVTIWLNILSLLLGCVLGFGLFIADYSNHPVVEQIVKKLDVFMIYVPDATWIVMVFYLLCGGKDQLAFLAAVIALTIKFAFKVYESFFGLIDEVDNRELDAAFSMGYTKYGALFKLYLPKKMPEFLEEMKSEVPDHIKSSSLVEFIMVMDIQCVIDELCGAYVVPIVPIFIATVMYFAIEIGAAKLIGLIHIKAEKREDEIKSKIKKGHF